MGTDTGRTAPAVIELEEMVDPLTGASYFGTPGGPAPQSQQLAVRGGALAPLGTSVPEQDSVTLPDERFAGDPDDVWSAAEKAQANGGEVRIVNGQLVYGPPGEEPGQSVSLPNERFAAMAAADVEDMRRLVASGAASFAVDTLRSTAEMPDYFPTDPGGIYLHTKPTRLGDELHVVIKHDPSTGLYHAHLWAFMLRERGSLKVVDLNRWVGTHPTLSAHRVHLYPGSGRDGAVLCLSTRTRGGMPTLRDCVLQCAKWAAGMGEVVRGRTFPYQQ